MRDAAINLRALPEQRDLINHAANVLGKSRSDFILEAACERAQAVLLDPAKFQQFIALLDTPPAPNHGVARLLAVKAPWAEG